MGENKINRNGNIYTFLYATILVLVVATLLALCATWLKPMQQQNIDAATKIQILNTLGISIPKGENVNSFASSMFEKHIVDQFSIDSKSSRIDGSDAFSVNLGIEQGKSIDQQQFPLYKAINSEGKTKYIVPIRGKGLWGPIWGYIAIDDDLKTIYGVKFDHKSETPGLGADITTEKFQDQFIGKSFFNDDLFVSISVVKGGNTQNNTHAVDAISGATITSNGVEQMLYDCLKHYQKYFGDILAERQRLEQEAIRAAFVADSIKTAQIAEEEAAKEKALRAYRRQLRAKRDSIANLQLTTDSTAK